MSSGIETQFSNLLNKIENENDKQKVNAILRKRFLANYVPTPMSYIHSPGKRLWRDYIASLNDMITLQMVDELDSLSFGSYLKVVGFVEELRSKHRLNDIENSLFFWLQEICEQTKIKHIKESLKK